MVDVRRRLRDASFSHFTIIDAQRTGAARAGSAAGVSEIKSQRASARGHRLGRGDVVICPGQYIVRERELPVL